MMWFLLFQYQLSPHHTVSPLGNLHIQCQPHQKVQHVALANHVVGANQLNPPPSHSLTLALTHTCIRTCTSIPRLTVFICIHSHAFSHVYLCFRAYNSNHCLARLPHYDTMCGCFHVCNFNHRLATSRHHQSLTIILHFMYGGYPHSTPHAICSRSLVAHLRPFTCRLMFSLHLILSLPTSTHPISFIGVVVSLAHSSGVRGPAEGFGVLSVMFSSHCP
jgi:hypothetical protein